jgi:hypothetical protein
VAGQGRFRDDPAAPNGIKQVILADDALAVLHQEEQQIEDLWPDRHGLGMPGQLPPIRVERIFSKHVLHYGAPSPRARKSCKSG